MTEEEAKKKWCPFARTIPAALNAGIMELPSRIVPPHNRVQEPGDNDEATWHAAHNCIGCQCMAWRWDGRDDGELIATGKGHVPKDRAPGYCGLAGKP